MNSGYQSDKYNRYYNDKIMGVFHRFYPTTKQPGHTAKLAPYASAVVFAYNFPPGFIRSMPLSIISLFAGMLQVVANTHVLPSLISQSPELGQLQVVEGVDVTPTTKQLKSVWFVLP